jgi:hypothetical protein
VGELIDEAGLAHAGFPHDGDELAVAIAREGERPADLLDLGVSTDEPRQSPSGDRVESSTGDTMRPIRNAIPPRGSCRLHATWVPDCRRPHTSLLR